MRQPISMMIEYEKKDGNTGIRVIYGKSIEVGP